jgi:hypothetical protein
VWPDRSVRAKRFVVVLAQDPSGDAARRTSPQINVVLNFAEELNARTTVR